MKPISFKRHRFPADVIRQAVWLYFRFSLSFRDVEELMAARGVDVSYERWCQSNDNLSPAGEGGAGGVILSRRASSTRQMRPLFGL